MVVSGLVVPIITPRLNGSFDSSSFVRHIHFLIRGGVDAIFVLGTTGEFQFLSREEKVQVIQCASEAINGRVPLLVGASENTLAESLEMMQVAKRFGAHATVVAPMYSRELLLGFGSLLDEAPLPVFLYNNPAIHRDEFFPLEMVEMYLDHPLVVGMKDSSKDDAYFDGLLSHANDSFAVFPGPENKIPEHLIAGAAGSVSGNANVDPVLFRKAHDTMDSSVTDEITAFKGDLKRGEPNSIRAIKKRLKEVGIIDSDELFS